ncbi:hypothetical protein GQ42DRAFT_3392 [Ramicandelaber brevisporus]|nr:hypothetical protein GQ42DRAFT_3392 [Ramicandelaber brevisporus]
MSILRLFKKSSIIICTFTHSIDYFRIQADLLISVFLLVLLTCGAMLDYDSRSRYNIILKGSKKDDKESNLSQDSLSLLPELSAPTSEFLEDNSIGNCLLEFSTVSAVK